MTFSQIMNSKLLYILVIAAIAYVLVFSVLTLIHSWKHGQEIGLSKEKLKGAIISSAIYSILPSISIIIGLFSLTAVLGVSWSWFRLSVVGSNFVLFQNFSRYGGDRQRLRLHWCPKRFR